MQILGYKLERVNTNNNEIETFSISNKRNEWSYIVLI